MADLSSRAAVHARDIARSLHPNLSLSDDVELDDTVELRVKDWNRFGPPAPLGASLSRVELVCDESERHAKWHVPHHAQATHHPCALPLHVLVIATSPDQFAHALYHLCIAPVLRHVQRSHRDLVRAAAAGPASRRVPHHHGGHRRSRHPVHARPAAATQGPDGTTGTGTTSCGCRCGRGSRRSGSRCPTSTRCSASIPDPCRQRRHRCRRPAVCGRGLVQRVEQQLHAPRASVPAGVAHGAHVRVHRRGRGEDCGDGWHLGHLGQAARRRGVGGGRWRAADCECGAGGGLLQAFRMQVHALTIGKRPHVDRSTHACTLLHILARHASACK